MTPTSRKVNCSRRLINQKTLSLSAFLLPKTHQPCPRIARVQLGPPGETRTHAARSDRKRTCQKKYPVHAHSNNNMTLAVTDPLPESCEQYTTHSPPIDGESCIYIALFIGRTWQRYSQFRSPFSPCYLGSTQRLSDRARRLPTSTMWIFLAVVFLSTMKKLGTAFPPARPSIITQMRSNLRDGAAHFRWPCTLRLCIAGRAPDLGLLCEKVGEESGQRKKSCEFVEICCSASTQALSNSTSTGNM